LAHFRFGSDPAQGRLHQFRHSQHDRDGLQHTFDLGPDDFVGHVRQVEE
jgi:hypothetical protein